MIFIASAWPITGLKNISELIAFCAITGFKPPGRFIVYLSRDRKLNDGPLDQTLDDLVDTKVDISTIDDVEVERDSVILRRSSNEEVGEVRRGNKAS